MHFLTRTYHMTRRPNNDVCRCLKNRSYNGNRWESRYLQTLSCLAWTMTHLWLNNSRRSGCWLNLTWNPSRLWCGCPHCSVSWDFFFLASRGSLVMDRLFIIKMTGVLRLQIISKSAFTNTGQLQTLIKESDHNGYSDIDKKLEGRKRGQKSLSVLATACWLPIFTFAHSTLLSCSEKCDQDVPNPKYRLLHSLQNHEFFHFFIFSLFAHFLIHQLSK